MTRVIEFNFKENPPLVQVGIILFLLLVTSFVIYLFLFSPKLKEISSIKTKLDSLEENILKASKLKNEYNLPTEEEKMLWEKTRLELWSKIPPQKNSLLLMKNLALLARQFRIKDISFDIIKSGEASRLGRQSALPSPGETKTASSEEAFALELKPNFFFLKTSFHCRYQDLAAFLEGVESLPRLLEIKLLLIKRELPLMAADLTIKAYFLPREKDA